MDQIRDFLSLEQTQNPRVANIDFNSSGIGYDELIWGCGWFLQCMRY
ncbi:MAG: hypothetical protein R3A45_10600 [Bdellovibrionota bacterium]